MRFIAVLLLTFASTSSALAGGGWTANELLEACRGIATLATFNKDDPPDDQISAGICIGMIGTLMITGRDYSDNKFCSPDHATIQQGAKVLVKFLDDHPQALNLPAAPLAVAAFRVAWPCPKTN